MKLTEHFDSNEFTCRHCGKRGVQLPLVYALEKLRQLIGRPVIVSSGYRCAKHSVEAAKAQPGLHRDGLAADIYVVGMTARELYQYVRQVPEFRGIGVDDEQGYVHVDIRSTPPAKWCYAAGQTIPWKETAA